MVGPKTSQLDARAIAPRERDAAILAAFDRLAVNDTLELLCEQEPRSAYDALHTTRAGDYAWVTLDSRPHVWRGALTRLSGRHASGPVAAGAGASESGCCGVCGGTAHIELPRRAR